jgi:hypothetical protein
VSFGDQQTGALDKANDRTISTITIVETCEAQRRQSVEKLTRPWWRMR